jgi:hypothetical protein
VVSAAVATAAVGTACNGESGGTAATPTETDARVEVVDVAAGSYRGVRLGASRAEVFAALGRAPNRGPATTLSDPSGSDGPPVVVLGGDRRRSMGIYRYRHAVAMLGDGRLRALLVDEPAAGTAEEVGVGDPLERVEEVYPDAVCGQSQENTEYEPFPACYVRVSAKRHVWFGGDPIKSITIAVMKIGDL